MRKEGRATAKRDEKRDGKRAFGQRLYEMRKAHHLTQEQLAEKLDIDSRMLSRYENGDTEMGALLYEKLLAVLHEEETDLPALWNKLNDENRRRAEELLRMMLQAQYYEAGMKNSTDQ